MAKLLKKTGGAAKQGPDSAGPSTMLNVKQASSLWFPWRVRLGPPAAS